MEPDEATKSESSGQHFFVVIDRGATVLGPFLSQAEAVKEGRELRGHSEFVVMQFPATTDPASDE